MKSLVLRLIAILLVLTIYSFYRFDPEKSIPKHYRYLFSYVPSEVVEQRISDHPLAEFFMFTGEVTNLQYREFLNNVKESGNTTLYEIALWDTTNWRREYAYNEPFVQYYHSHPAYNDYPALNMTREGAMAYCQWLEDKLNLSAVESSITYHVSLPSRAQWIRAASGNLHGFSYAWGGPNCNNALGCPLANYKVVDDSAIAFDEKKNDYTIDQESLARSGGPTYMTVTAPVFSYSPNDFGLYNMNGNAAEMVVEPGIAVGGHWNSTGYDIRNESTMTFEGSSPFVGFRPILTTSIASSGN